MDSRDEIGRPVFRAPSYSSGLERDLTDAQNEIRRLGRELKKHQQRLAETAEAYNKTVSNLVRTVHENTILRYEYERLKQRTPDTQLPGPTVMGLNLTRIEVAAIRKAIARVHHPDVGGDSARMQAWNVVLDQIEDQCS